MRSSYRVSREQNLTAEKQYGYRSTKPKPKNMAKKIKHFKAIVHCEKRASKDQPFRVEFDERVDIEVKKRYSREHDACRAAVRHYRERILNGKTPYDQGVRITLPNNRERMGWVWSDGSIHFDAVTNKKK